MRFGPEFLDELRNRVSLAEVVGKRVALKKRGRNFLGLCPFHREKTPSFNVHDDKGFYHCFGCQTHGDVIDFVMRTENVTFPEAVEKIAGLAGMKLPAPSPREAERDRETRSLNQVLEAAAHWFAEQLKSPAGSAARKYLEDRGLTEAQISRFRLGFAPEKRGALKAALVAQGFPEKMLIDSGLVIVPDEGGDSFDRFRGRVMFPITERRGRVIAFGGRAMGDIKPKYLNSPETALFHKGRVLYNLANALPAARAGGEIIVAEGYMDVIALDQAGFQNAVAPLGTALTEDQMMELWRVADEPILCFDGDDAGLRAAGSAAQRAVPLLKPGHSLRFALLPAGEDPDSLLRKEGPEAITRVLEAASPLAWMLWTLETAGKAIDTPERRAQLRQTLERLAGGIKDPGVRNEYRRHFERRCDELFGPLPVGGSRPFDRGRQQSGRQRPGRPGSGPPRGPSTVPSTIQGQGTKVRIDADEILQKTLLAAVINHPALLDEICEDIGIIELSAPDLDRLRQAVLDISGQSGLDSETLKNHLREQGFSGELRAVLRADVYQHSGFARPDTALEIVRKGWDGAFGKYQLPILSAQVREAEEAVARDTTPENQQRFYDLKKRLYELQQKAREWTG
jgi:DNA primase